MDLIERIRMLWFTNNQNGIILHLKLVFSDQLIAVRHVTQFRLVQFRGKVEPN